MVKIIACFQLQNRSSRVWTPLSKKLVQSFGYRKLPEQLLNISVLKLDGSSFVIHVARNATVADLKQAVEEAFNFSWEDEGKILWSLVWSHFCLCYGSQKLVNDKTFINCFGMKDGDQLQFAQHVTLEYRPAKQKLDSQCDQSKQCYMFLNDQQELKAIMSHKVSDKQLQAITDTVFGVTNKAKVIDVIKCMRTASLNAVPIVESSNEITEDHTQLVNGKKRKIVGTFSATDLRGCPVSKMQPLLNLEVLDFLKMLSGAPKTGMRSSWREQVTCHPESSLGEVVEKVVSDNVHRVWVVDEQGLLEGVVSLTDMIRVIRLWYLTEFLQ